jgi:hypothetical protein
MMGGFIFCSKCIHGCCGLGYSTDMPQFGQSRPNLLSMISNGLLIGFCTP